MTKLNFGAREVIGGLALCVIAIAGLWLSRGYNIGTATEMSTGYVPRLLCWLLLGFGMLIAVKALFTNEGRMGPVAWRPLLMVMISILAFAVTIERFGLIVASVLVVVCGSFAGKDVRAGSIIGSAIVLSAGCVILFVWLLGQPIPVLPGR